jgi:hypothetical protein
MAKRFTDTAIWQDDWFMNLPPDYKLAFMFIKDNCDQAGVWKPNKRLAETMLGVKIEWDDFLISCDGRVKLIQGEYWWITRFVEFQYGTLSENCKPHIPVINLLKKYQLFERVSKGYPKGIETLEEKEKDKEEEKVKEKEIEKAVLKLQEIQETEEANLYPTFEDFWNEYDKKIGDKVKLKKKWDKLSQNDKEIILDYIPMYKLSQPDKKYRKNPDTFLNNQSWNDELLNNGKQATNNQSGFSLEKTNAFYDALAKQQQSRG